MPCRVFRNGWFGSIRQRSYVNKRQCKVRDVRFSENTSASIARWAEALEALAGLPCFWQHGDFCLNNVLVSPARLSIIDFEEFGGPSMPLHDEIGLALSTNALAR